MKRLFLLFFLGLLAATNANGYDNTVSPDGRFRACATPHNPDGTGMRLFLAPARGANAGVLLLENDRWIKARWSPDSRYLAVINGLDGHITDIFVYRVIRDPKSTATKARYANLPGPVAATATAPGVFAKLCYHTPGPGTYDVKWSVAGWDISHQAILLAKETRKASDQLLKVALD